MNNSGSCISCGNLYCAKKVALFESFSDSDLAKVLDLIERIQFQKGEVIFSEGQVFDRLYIVNTGSLKVFRNTKEGKEQILYVLSDGDFLGDLSLLKKETFKFSSVALVDTSLCTIQKDKFDLLMKNYPELYERVLEYAHDRISALEDLVRTLTTKDTDARLAALLIKLADSFGIRKKDGIEIQFPLTREEMASFIGLTRETISRKLSNFQTKGYIEIYENKLILIRDIEAIKNLTMI